MAKITEKNLIQGLNELKKVKPNQNWVIFCRERIIAQIHRESVSSPVLKPQAASSFWAWAQFFSSRAFLRPALTLTTFFALLFGSGMFVLAKAKDSLPGERFFPVKIALEQARLFVTSSADGKAEFQNEMVASRLDELNRLLKSSGPMAENDSQIEEAVNNLQKHLLTAKDELPKLANSEAKRAVEVARKIDDNANQAEQALSQVKESLSPEAGQILAEKIAEATDEADKTSTKALEVMVNRQADNSEISQAEILAKLDEKIQKTEQKLQSVKNTVNSAIGNAETKNEFPINASIILDQSDKAKEVLDQARASLKQNDVAGALQTVKMASEMAKSAEKLADAMVNASVIPSVIPSDGSGNQNATGTVPVIKPATSTPSSMIKPSFDANVSINVLEPILATPISGEVEIIINIPAVQGTTISNE